MKESGSKPAARIRDLTVRGGTHRGEIHEGSANMLINRAPAARVSDLGTVFGGGEFQVKGGAPCVLINGRHAHRIGDTVLYGDGRGTTARGSPNVLIGDWEGPGEHRWTWVEVELRDENGERMGGEVYAVKLPDGSIRFGRLDKNGRGRVEWTKGDASKCQIWFPDLGVSGIKKL